MAKIKNKLGYLLTLVVPFFTVGAVAQEEPKTAGSDEEARSSSSGRYA